MFDAKVTALGEYIDHRVKEKRTEMFSKACAAKGLDFVTMHELLPARKEVPMGELTATV